MVADRKRCITVENGDRGLIIYENPVGVLTNSPYFPYHLTRLADYRGLCPTTPENRLSDHSPEVYSRGMGAIGLPGDYSSSSRFVRAVFVKSHTSRTSEPVSRFFHVMDSVKVPLGCIKCDSGKDVSTVYTSCADPEDGIYYYTTYGSRGIHGVAFDRELISESEIKIYPLSHKESIELS
jgi:choloylglycine hydrolase